MDGQTGPELTHAPTTAKQQIAIPIRTAEGSGSGPGQKLQLASAGGASQNSTENRWLGRMVSNTLGEVRARADLHDNAGALLKEKVAAEAEEGEERGGGGGGLGLGGGAGWWWTD